MGRVFGLRHCFAWLLTLALATSFAPKLVAGETVTGTSGAATDRAVVNFSELADREAHAPAATEKLRETPRHLTRAPSSRVMRLAAKTLGLSPTVLSPFSSSLPSPPLATNFLALGDNNTFFPPNTTGAVGPNHLMVMLNSQVRIQNRNGGAISTVSLSNFWASVSNPSPDPSDPRLLYDPYNNRWIAAACADDLKASSSVLVGVSANSDPTGNWYLYREDVDSSNVYSADFTSLGFNKKWIVVSVNMFTISTTNFHHVNVYAFNKTNLYAHSTGAFALMQASTGSTLSPAVTHDNGLGPEYLVEDWDGSNGQLRVSSINGVIGNETLNTGISFPTTAAIWQAGGFGDNAPQKDSDRTIDTGDSRILNCVYHKGSLWCAQTGFLTNGYTAAQWWEIIATNGAVRQFGRVEDPGETNYFAYPSIAVNVDNDVLLGYSRFSDLQFASGNYAFRYASDPLNTMRNNTVLKAGEGVYNKHGSRPPFLNRWGDYSQSVVDPVNDRSLWTIQEYAATPVGDPSVNGSGRWGTWWGRLDPNNPLRITSITRAANGHYTIVWNSVGDTRYRVQYSNGAGNGSYNSAYTDIVRSVGVETDPSPAGTASSMTFTDDFTLSGGPPPNGARYYRIKVVQ